MTPILTPAAEDVLYLLDLPWWVHRAAEISPQDLTQVLPSVAGCLARLFREQQPRYLAAAVESIGPTWRHQRYPADRSDPNRDRWTGYKVRRPPKSEAFLAQSAAVEALCAAYAIPIGWAEGWEGDDVLATWTRQARAEGLRVVVVTLDKDLGALATDGGNGGTQVVAWSGERDQLGPIEVRDGAKLRERWGVAPGQMRDLLALMGDASDDIPGAKGVGEIRAARLVSHFGGAREACAAAVRLLPVVESAGKEAAKVAKLHGFEGSAVCRSLAAHAPHVDLSYDLAGLRDDAPIALDLDDCAVGGFELDKLHRIYLSHGCLHLMAEATMQNRAKRPRRPEGERRHVA